MSLNLCDRCSARARDRFTKSEAMELAFCGHHSDKYRESLSSQGFTVVLTPSQELAKSVSG